MFRHPHFGDVKKQQKQQLLPEEKNGGGDTLPLKQTASLILKIGILPQNESN